MRSSLRLREAQTELMMKKQGQALLSKSFQKWKDFSRKRRMRKLPTQSRAETSEEDSLPFQKGQQEKSFVSLGVVYEMEGTPEIKLYPRWKSGSGDRRVPTTEDLRRLAVFHLWHLRKALAAQIHKEAWAEAELGRKKLRRAFQVWRARTMNIARISPLVTRHQRAQLHRKLRLLRSTLRQWRQKVQVAAESPHGSCSGCPQELLVGFQDSEESSSGFLGSVLAPLGSSTPRGSSEGARSPTDNSSSFQSLAGDDSPWVLALDLRPPPLEASKSWRISIPFGEKHPGPRKQSLACASLGEETCPQRKAVQVPRVPRHLDTLWQEERYQEGSQQALEARQHRQITHQTRMIHSCNQEAAAQRAWQELSCQKPVWGVDQEALHHWQTSWHRQQALKELCHQWSQHRASIHKKRAFGKWQHKASMQRNPASCQEPTSLQMSPWAHWSMALTRGMPSHQLAEEDSTCAGPRPRIYAMHSWRLAIRRHGTLRADPNTLMKKASNYWTRAITLAQAKQKHCSHIGQRKLRKMSVSLGAPKQGFLLASSPSCVLHCSSFQLWLQLYRKQGKAKAKGLTSQEELRKATRQGGGSSRTILIPKSKDHWKAAMLKGTWLERKYLQRWRHEVMLRRFHNQQRTRRLAEVWQCWIDAQRAEQLAQTLVRQRWLEWGWEMWRRRWLQLQVGLHLQDSRIGILSQAFGRWHQSWAARVPRRGSTSQLPGVEGQALPALLAMPPSGEEVQLCPIPSHSQELAGEKPSKHVW
ncbi:uncharacterized protein C1orf167 homolog [Gracilinanus agilis]|uniref:uncharacterized protein C1orf167 homolog n=1 Tax=Gracilinanus agilis TaxID=191870 RepID=UPI001CFD85AE|nr:uncharacterized protein C1orf167 homolog [Gracilinanus agilis]